MKLKILAIVALGAIGIGAAFVAVGGLPAKTASTTQYLTSAAATGDVTNDVAATGSIATTVSFGLAFGSPPHLAGASASGGSGGSTTWRVTQVGAKVGDTVKKDAVLAVADTTELQRQLDAATAAWKVAKIQLLIAQDTRDSASGTKAIRQAKIGLYNAQTQVSNSAHARQDLQAQIAAATLKAPIDGIVTAVDIVAGLDAPSGDAMVVDSGEIQVTADVVESDLASMALGQTASVTIGAVDATLAGTVAAIAPTASNSSTNGSVVSYAVTVAFKDAPRTIRPGMTADITITTDRATAVLTVPAAALRGTTGSYAVLVMGEDGQPVATPVQVGLVTNTTAEIRSGLSVGQEVVTGVNTPQTGSATTGGGGFGGGFGGGIPGVGGGGNRRGTGN